MKGERDAAIRAVAGLAAIAAKQRSGKSAPIQKQNGLFSFFEPIGDRGAQFFRQNRGRLFFPPFLAQIDNAHERHLLFVDPLGKGGQPVFSASAL